MPGLDNESFRLWLVGLRIIDGIEYFWGVLPDEVKSYLPFLPASVPIVIGWQAARCLQGLLHLG